MMSSDQEFMKHISAGGAPQRRWKMNLGEKLVDKEVDVSTR
jgi:hypothetical protein